MGDISKAIEAARMGMPHIEYRLNEPMKNHTSFRVGAPLRAMFFPKNAVEMTDLCVLLHRYEIVPLIVGNGTNLLVDDSKTLEMIAVKTSCINDVLQTGKTEITAGAGISLPKLAQFACGCSLTGIEFAHGIPGSLGGAVSMNAGAYGTEMKDVVLSTEAYSPHRGTYKLTGMEHEFSYRHSRLTDTEDIILSTTIQLREDDKDNIASCMDELAARRRNSQPLDLPSAGSTFKRPKNGYAADLIERAGLKGFTVGDAQVSRKHAGFVVNNGNATFRDIMAVIDHVRETVFKQFGIELELENKIVRS